MLLPMVGHSLGCSLAALMRAWRARVDAVSTDLPQASRGYEVLMAIRLEEPRSQAALAARLGFDRTVMTYLVDRFEADGLITRRSDPQDRRARRLALTERGAAVLEGLDVEVAAIEAELLEPLSPDERRTLIGLLRRPLGADSA